MKKHLFILNIAGLFFSCQREEAEAPFATDTDISVLPSTETKASDNGLLGWVALTGQTHINNFGWEGSLYGFSTSTGWYHINVFDALGNKEYSNTYKSGIPYNYQFKKKIIVNIQ